jgi:hypothetical protein
VEIHKMNPKTTTFLIKANQGNKNRLIKYLIQNNAIIPHSKLSQHSPI